MTPIDFKYDRLILRKLTKKSTLNFGNDPHLTVEEHLNVGKKAELVWAYYNLSKISFADDVLDELGIKPEERIAKPGKDTDLGDEVIKRFETTDLINKLKRNKQRFIDRFTMTRAIQKLNKAAVPIVTIHE